METLIIIWKAIKKSAGIVIVILIGLLIAALAITIHNNKTLKDELSRSVENEKAFMSQLNSDKSRIREYSMTIDMLRLMNDSVTAKLIEAKDKLKIKDKNLERMGYMLAKFKSDTFYITRRDTIFLDPELCIDTIIGDEWMNIWLKLQYPNIIEVSSEAQSEKEVFISTRRETIKPPKKFFLWRWFQKKHTVTEVNIKEENPYIKSQNNVFYKISK